MFPQEGVQYGALTLKWPSLKEFLVLPEPELQDTIPELSPEELLAIELEAVRQARESDFRLFCDTSTLRICLPGGDCSYLDPFFAALDSAVVSPVRIVHYGDSQLEGDRITSNLREHLQSQFGGCGVGLFPLVQPIQRQTVMQTLSPEEQKNYFNFGGKSHRAGHNRYGPMCQFAHVDTAVTVIYQPLHNNTFEHSRKCLQVSVFAQGTGTMKIQSSYESVSLVEVPREDSVPAMFVHYKGNLKQPSGKVVLDIAGSWDIYGISLEDSVGVIMDNIPLRGSAGTTFASINKEAMCSFFEEQNVRLILLQFGVNAVSALTTTKAIMRYQEYIAAQIDYFHEVCPSAKILFIGPADMSTSVQGEFVTYPQLPEVVDSLRSVTNAHGAAFWSAYDAMGGWNSMPKWVASHPALGTEDYIHFTRKGADRIADLFYEILQTYYSYYRIRNRLDAYDKETISLIADTVAYSDSVSL